ncbi:multiheme c-type cytochrome [Pareuzebyella sediminis]|uniref:multiheme c-type cytochrome n=1 Tax=Pareuzebyella sediminis TaxID=2607998 RepID=UPI0018E12212|nr:multiheme c-type cytochrome [Pareuzebyella sediminis]
MKSILIVVLCFGSILVYHCKNPTVESDYYNPEVLATHDNGEKFVGSETCMECHANIYTDHLKTAHHRTSLLANDSTILGSFDPGSNVLDLEYVKFTMERRLDSFYQHTAYKNRLKKSPPSSFDIVIGSGVMGQTYLTWEEDKLFQLQSSYHKPADSWVNSPGFPTYAIQRPVRDGCIKCHVTFAKNRNIREGNQYDREKILYGIECERCHRPAARHVIYHRKHPEAKMAKFMVNIDSLTRQQRLDVCAQCHSGPQNEQLKGNPFSFLTGENLNEYSRNSGPMSSTETLDVHGNQYGLLTRSECFKQTQTMDCTTCHDPHKNQRGDTEYFNHKCMQCHVAETKKPFVVQDHLEVVGNDCISCHMPKMRSQSISIKLTGKDSISSSFSIRTHFIKVYKDSLVLP